MKKRNIINCVAVVLGICLCLLLCAAPLLQAQPSEPSLKIGDAAPPLDVEAWLQKQPEKVLGKGRVHVVEFWATWCQPCLANIPHLSAIAEKYADQGVSVYGISVMERKGVDLDSMKRFMKTPIAQQMKYAVATDGQEGRVKSAWLAASGQRGIPHAMVVNQQGLIAWTGHPAGLDKVLPDILAGKWDVEVKAKEAVEARRLKAKDDNEVVLRLNPYMGRDYSGGIQVLDSLLAKEPGLAYYPKTGHFRFFCLMGTDQENAVDFVRKWWAANDVPNWKTVSDGIASFSSQDGFTVSPETYLIGIEALEQQLKHYPWSMNFERTYGTIADYYDKAGLPEKAAEIRKKAEAL